MKEKLIQAMMNIPSISHWMENNEYIDFLTDNHERFFIELLGGWGSVNVKLIVNDCPELIPAITEALTKIGISVIN